MLLDIDSTVEVKVGERTWVVSAVPAGMAAELTSRPASVLAPTPEGLIIEVEGKATVAPGREAEWSDLCAVRFGQHMAIHAEWIRWGLRSLASPGVARRYAGRDFKLLDDAKVEALLRVNGGALAHALGGAIRAANAVSEEEALGFLSPSGS